MSTKQIHEGKRLKWWIEQNSDKKKDFLEKMGFSNYSHLHYYFNMQRIKMSTLEKFLNVLGITLDEFYNGKPGSENVTNDEEAVYTLSAHNGINLHGLVSEYGMSDTVFAEKMDISRKTLYEWYKLKKLDEGILLKAAKILKVPLSQLKGNGEREKSFEYDIYVELRKINNSLNEIMTFLKM